MGPQKRPRVLIQSVQYSAVVIPWGRKKVWPDSPPGRVTWLCAWQSAATSQAPPIFHGQSICVMSFVGISDVVHMKIPHGVRSSPGPLLLLAMCTFDGPGNVLLGRNHTFSVSMDEVVVQYSIHPQLVRYQGPLKQHMVQSTIFFSFDFQLFSHRPLQRSLVHLTPIPSGNPHMPPSLAHPRLHPSQRCQAFPSSRSTPLTLSLRRKITFRVHAVRPSCSQLSCSQLSSHRCRSPARHSI